MMDFDEVIDVLNRLYPLSHWARVAFAANCARTVVPLFGGIPGDERTIDRRVLLESGIEGIESSAEQGKPIIEPEKIKIDFTIARGAARRAVHDRDEQSEPTEEEEFGLELNEEIVDICEHALEAFESTPAESAAPTFMTFVMTKNLVNRLESGHVVGILIAALEWLEFNAPQPELSPHAGVSLKEFREQAS
jgi:hypothetical protein